MERDQRPTYPLRCPVCGTSMVGEKTAPEREDFDLHRCLNCGATISMSGATREDGDVG